MIKSLTRWAGYVACMGDRRGVYRVWWGDLRKRDHLEDPVIEGRKILKRIFREVEFRCTDWICLAQDRGR